MRNCSPTPPFASDSASHSGATPINASIDIIDRWCYLVRSWAFGINIILHDDFAPDIPLVLNGVFSWNYNNSIFINPETGDAPIHEQFLGLGYQIKNANFDGTGFSLTNGSFDLFRSDYSNSGRPGSGYWNDGGIIKPYLRITAGRCESTTAPGTSAVVCTIDGIAVPMQDALGATQHYTGTVILTPSTFWPYRRADLTNPMYDGSGHPILPRQTDELA